MKELLAVPAALWLAACAPSMPEVAAPVVAPAVAQEAEVAPSPLPSTPPAADDPASVNQSIDEVLGGHAQYEQVILRLQRAVAERDAAAVAGLVQYPFTTVRDGKPLKVVDAQAFVREYERIMTPEIAAAITRQKYSQLVVNYKGVMFGNGEAWVNGICLDTACTRVEVRVVALQPGS